MSGKDLVFYTHPQSRGRVVRWMLEEIGARYTTRVVEYGPAMKSPEYLAINPMGKVPAIVHGGEVVTETAAICAYLADVFPEAGLGPEPGNRGAYYRWLFFAAGPFEAARADRMLGIAVPEDKRGMIGYGSYELALDVLEKAVSGGEYIAGGRFSAADIYLGSNIGWGMHFGSLEARAAFKDYWARVSNREAKRRADEIDDALMPEAA